MQQVVYNAWCNYHGFTLGSVEIPSIYRPLLHLLVTYLLRRAIVNRTNGKHKHLCIYLFLLTVFGPIYYDVPP